MIMILGIHYSMVYYYKWLMLLKRWNVYKQPKPLLQGRYALKQ